MSRHFILLISVAGMLATHAGCATPVRQKRTFPIPSGPAKQFSEDGGREVSPPMGGGFLQLRDGQGRQIQIQWEKQSASVGKPNGGRLEGGVQFPKEGPGWMRKGGNGFGTDETVRILNWAFQENARVFPGTVPVVLGDLSAEGGGPLKSHKSHQSGRDADIGYFADGNRPLRFFETMDESNLDTEKTWHLVETLVVTGYVRFIFMSYRVQELLYEEALQAGWTPENLASIFQYPRGPKARQGLIRHAKGHQDHFHIRFKCPAGDAECIP